MNERIRELVAQAEDYASEHEEHWHDGPDWQELFSRKFAELIVRECAQYMYEHYPHSRYEINYMRKHMGDADWNKPIKEHFGVE